MIIYCVLIVSYMFQQEKLANDRARKSVELKKIKTHTDREKKEHVQKANFRRYYWIQLMCVIICLMRL